MLLFFSSEKVKKKEYCCIFGKEDEMLDILVRRSA